MSYSRSAAVLLVFLFICFTAPFSRADWPPVPKEELEYKNVPNVPDAPAVILFHEESDDDLLHFHQVYYRIKILTEAGRKYADVQVPFNKHGDDVDKVKGRTTHADGSVVNFEGKPLEKEVLRGQGYRYNMKTITLPDVQVGSVIEYGYSWRYDDNMVAEPTWVLQEDLYQRREHYRFVPTERSVLNEDSVASSGLAWVSNLPKGAEVKTFHDKHFELTISEVPPFIDEEQMPPAETFKFRVNFYYRYAAKAEDYWKDVGKNWSKRAEKFIGKNGGVREALATLIQPSDSNEQKAKNIYAFVQTLENTRYLPDKSLEELKANGLKPNMGVDDVLRQKRGSRDEITRLFVAMCRAAGIPAYLMWVTDRNIAIFAPVYTNFRQLDDEIAFAMIDGKEVALDPGTKFAPYGLINWRYTGSQGLKQNSSGKTELAQSPLPTTGGDVVQRVGAFLLAEDGEAKGSLMVRFYGQEALSRRIRGSKTDAAGRKKMFEDEVKEWLPSNAEVTMTKEPNWLDYEHPLTGAVKLAAPVLSKAGKRMLLPSNFLAANRPPMFSRKERTQLVYFHYPLREVDSIRITIPMALEVESLSPSSEVEEKFAGYKSTHKQEQTTIITDRDLELGQLVFAPSDYPTLKGFYDKVKQGDDEQVVLRSAMHAQAH